MGVLNPNSTPYVHPNEPNLLNIHKAMTYRDGEPHLRVDLGSDNITITGDVNLIDTVNLSSSTLAALETVTISNTSFAITNFPTSWIAHQGTSPWFVTGTVAINNFPTAITVTNFTSTVHVDNFPTSVTVSNFTSTVNIASLPAVTGTVTGTVTVNGSVTVTNFTSTVNVSSLPAVSGTVTVSNFTSTVHIDNFPTTSTVYQGTTPWITSGTVNIGTMPEVEIKNDSGNPVPVTGTINIQSTGNQGKLWTTQVAQGLVAGHTTVQTTGYNPTTSAGDAVWAGGTAYPWASLTTAQTLYLKSSTNNDTDRNSHITIHGLDANYDELYETVTLNASDSRTAVATVNQFLRIHHMYVDAGIDTNVGDITATITSGSGTVVNKMLAGRGVGYTGTFTVPAGKTGYLYKGDASSTAATVVDFYVRYFGKVFMVSHVAIVDNSTYVYDFPFPPTLPEKTDMYCKINVGSGKTAINFEVLLVDNP